MRLKLKLNKIVANVTFKRSVLLSSQATLFPKVGLVTFYDTLYVNFEIPYHTNNVSQFAYIFKTEKERGSTH